MAELLVVSKATGRKRYVPEHYMTHPVLSKPFRLAPSEAARQEKPSEDWTIQRLRDWAEDPEHTVDLSGKTTKADIYDAVSAHPAAAGSED